MVLQVLVAAITAVAFLALGEGSWSALSALCGGGVSLCIVLLLRRGVRRAGELALVDQKKSMMILYLGAVERFIAIIVMFALGLGVLGLEPLAMFTGFALTQISNVISARG